MSLQRGEAWKRLARSRRCTEADRVAFSIPFCAAFALISARSSPPPCGHGGEQHSAGEDADPDSARKEWGLGTGGWMLRPASLGARWPASPGQMAGCQRSLPRRPSVPRQALGGAFRGLSIFSFSFFRSSYRGVRGWGTRVMAGWCSRREELGRPRRDLGIGRDARPAPPSGPNSPCDLSKRLGISVPVPL